MKDKIDKDLVREAQALTGIKDLTLLLEKALERLIETESARKLAKLGGAEPLLEKIRRRR